MAGYITNSITQDGFGARMHRVIHAMAVTYHLRDKFGVDLKYVYSPLNYEGWGVDFNMGVKARTLYRDYPYSEVNRDDYLNRAILWDNRIRYSGTTIHDINLNEVTISDKRNLMSDAQRKSVDDKLYVVDALQKEFNINTLNINMVDSYHSEIMKNFKFTPSINDNSIIIHIRRNEIIKYFKERYVVDEYYLEILEALIPDRNKYNITIHTQRHGFDSEKYSDWDVVYDDEMDDFDAFVEMICAKVLIVGWSSFSYTAALLNKNLVVYPPRINGWIAKGLDSWINSEQFIKSLT